MCLLAKKITDQKGLEKAGWKIARDDTVQTVVLHHTFDDVLNFIKKTNFLLRCDG